MKNNVSKIKNCFGCGVCVRSCPVNIVNINLNKAGFYEPYISEQDKCIECGLCLKNCAFCHNQLASEPEFVESYGAWSNDEEIRYKCSSGGIGFEICRQLIAKGFKIIACRYNSETQKAEHYLATNEAELLDSIGSKYIQSYTSDAFKQINKSDKYAIVGTPCQIDSLRHLVNRLKISSNCILIDFFCHCVPSMFAWNGYLRMVENKIGSVESVTWRNKFNYGWHDSWLMFLSGKKGSYESRMSQGDMFYKLFLGDVAMNPACHKNCKYKMTQSSADIRVGDLWGSKYQNDEKGVSALIAFTAKGKEIIYTLSDVTIEPLPFNVAAEGQMKKNATPKAIAPMIMYLLRKGVKLDNITYKIAFTTQRILKRLKRSVCR